MQAVADKDKMDVGQLVTESAATFEVKRTFVETMTVRKGYGVWVALVYAGEDEPDPDEPVAAGVGVVKIEPAACSFVGGVLCAKVGDNFFVPVVSFGDDEDDLASDRFFETQAEADEHVRYITRALNFRGIEVS